MCCGGRIISRRKKVVDGVEVGWKVEEFENSSILVDGGSRVV